MRLESSGGIGVSLTDPALFGAMRSCRLYLNK